MKRFYGTIRTADLENWIDFQERGLGTRIDGYSYTVVDDEVTMVTVERR